MLDYIIGIKINIVNNLSNIQKYRYWFNFFPKGLGSHHIVEPTHIKICAKIIRVVAR